jgi:hypothetical protein
MTKFGDLPHIELGDRVRFTDLTLDMVRCTTRTEGIRSPHVCNKCGEVLRGTVVRKPGSIAVWCLKCF